MAATQHLSKLNPNHPIHHQSKVKSASSKMPIEKAEIAQSAEFAASNKSLNGLEKTTYQKRPRQSIFGLVFIIVAMAYVLHKMHKTTRESIRNDKICALQVRQLQAYIFCMMVTEGLWILSAVLEIGFRVRKALWEAKGRFFTEQEWGRETLAVLLPFYLGSFLTLLAAARMMWVSVVVKGSEVLC